MPLGFHLEPFHRPQDAVLDDLARLVEARPGRAGVVDLHERRIGRRRARHGHGAGRRLVPFRGRLHLAHDDRRAGRRLALRGGRQRLVQLQAAGGSQYTGCCCVLWDAFLIICVKAA